MTQDQDKFIVRLPDGMRERIKHEAAKNSRSMNAEIVSTLQEKYPEVTRFDLLMRRQLELFQRWEAEENPAQKKAMAEELLAVRELADKEIELMGFAEYVKYKEGKT